MSATASSTRPATGQRPTLTLVEGGEQRNLRLEKNPFTIGRKSDRDLVIADPRISREHAEIVLVGGEYYIVDLGSKHGTYLNGHRVEREKLSPDDRLEFGAMGGTHALFSPTGAHGPAREFLSQMSMKATSVGGTSDLEKLSMFLEAARKLNTTGVLDEILVTLVEATLRLTGAERGYVFLRDDNGELRLAAGRNSKGETLLDDRNISRSILEEAAHAASEFLVTDTTKSSDLASRQSIVAYDLRTVICIPLRKLAVQDKASENPTAKFGSQVTGVLYLDSRFAGGDISSVSHDLLRAIATEAAALVENARLVQAEQAARKYQQELSIAASIQQRLMAVRIPEVPYAAVAATNIPCVDVGGDFYDVVVTQKGLYIVLADVCGKGISAALLASILQGMIYSQVLSDVPLQEVVAATNRFLCLKDLGSKYATLFLAKIGTDGALEYVNCGHVPPLLVKNGAGHERLRDSNLPIGLLADARYQAGKTQLSQGDRLLVVTDGVTEAENAEGDFFGDERLEAAADLSSDDILTRIRQFCAETPFNDDCTLVELTYRG
jgi:sigma-B regulation protein RsbU (phosphoserine phosphatase)